MEELLSHQLTQQILQSFQARDQAKSSFPNLSESHNALDLFCVCVCMCVFLALHSWLTEEEAKGFCHRAERPHPPCNICSSASRIWSCLANPRYTNPPPSTPIHSAWRSGGFLRSGGFSLNATLCCLTRQTDRVVRLTGHKNDSNKF